MLISIASIGESSKRRVTSAYSSIVEPQTFAMKRVSLKSSVGRIFFDDVVDAGVLQADRVQHAGRCFPDAVRRIAEPRRERGALQHDGADGGVAKPSMRVYSSPKPTQPDSSTIGELSFRPQKSSVRRLSGRETAEQRRSSGDRAVRSANYPRRTPLSPPAAPAGEPLVTVHAPRAPLYDRRRCSM